MYTLARVLIATIAVLTGGSSGVGRIALKATSESDGTESDVATCVSVVR